MAHMHYFQDKVPSNLKERISKLISFLRTWDKITINREVIFSYRGKFGRWEEIHFYPIQGQGIGFKHILCLGQKKVLLDFITPGHFLSETFFEKITESSLFEAFSKANIITFWTQNLEKEWKIEENIFIEGVPNNPEKVPSYLEYNSIEDVDPTAIFSWIQTYGTTENQELKKIYFEKLKNLILG